jgi:carbonic anhydrase
MSDTDLSHLFDNNRDWAERIRAEDSAFFSMHPR